MPTTKVAMAPMKVAQIPKAGADFQIVEREIPKPVEGQVRIKVHACGVCHSMMCSQKMAPGPAFSIPAFQDTKLPASSTNWVPVFSHGNKDSA
jgi:hypothetical protein